MDKFYSQKNAQRLAAYSAMAAMGITSAYAQNNVYVDIEDATIEAAAIDDLFELDMDDNGVVDFVFRAGTASGGYWTFASIFGMFSSISAGNVNNQEIATIGTLYSLPYAVALSNGYAVNEDGSFLANTSSSNYAILASNFSGGLYGNFGDAGPNFIGLKFDADGDTHYGWIRVNVEFASPLTATILDYGYNPDADTEATTGDTTNTAVAIESLSDKIKSVYSFENKIMIHLSENVAVTASVYNVLGEMIYQKSIDGIETEIILQNVADGNYIVELKNEEGIYSKKVFLNK